MVNDDFFRSRLDQMIDLRRKAGGYAHAKQFKRLRRAGKRQRTILGVVIREIKRKLNTASTEAPGTITRLTTLLERAERIRTPQPKDKNKLYALHATETRKPYEFGVKTNIAITHKSGLVVGPRTFPGNPYDGHVHNLQLEQTTILLEDTGKSPKQVNVGLGYRGVDKDNSTVQIIHRGKYKSLTKQQKRWLKRRQAVEPAIGHLKSEIGWLDAGCMANWAMRSMRCSARLGTACAGCSERWSVWVSRLLFCAHYFGCWWPLYRTPYPSPKLTNLWHLRSVMPGEFCRADYITAIRCCTCVPP